MTAGKSLGAIEAYAKDERDGLPARWWLEGPDYVDDGDELWLSEADAKRIAAAWNATADIPTEALERGIVQEMVAALGEAIAHTAELEEAWRTGALDEHDGKGGTRSNRNVDVNRAMRRVLTRIRGQETTDDE